MTKSVTSVQNPIVKQAASLHLKKYRDETGLFLVEGEAMVSLALRYGWLAETIFVLDEHNSVISKNDKTIFVSKEALEKISKKENPQSVIGVFQQRKSTVLPPVINKMLPAFEEIRDPGNLGTILRSCHALDIKQILLIGHCCDPHAPETIRASMGSFSVVEVIATTVEEFINWTRMQGNTPIIGTDVLDATDYRHIPYQNSIILMGNEQKGLSPALKDICTMRAHIPMPGGTESLNVAIATTLLLYEALRNDLV
jgi:TrmH family RNA methyltransferase